ncbi:MAG: hypothetical protein ABI425_01190 [Patescibacteria group bacterium]
MTVLGLFLILLGWIIQLLCIEKHQRLHLIFLLAYISGVSFIVMDDFLAGDFIIGSLNLLILCVVLLVLRHFKRLPK